jgi:hypothetical protein
MKRANEERWIGRSAALYFDIRLVAIPLSNRESLHPREPLTVQFAGGNLIASESSGALQ